MRAEILSAVLTPKSFKSLWKWIKVKKVAFNFLPDPAYEWLSLQYDTNKIRSKRFACYLKLGRVFFSSCLYFGSCLVECFGGNGLLQPPVPQLLYAQNLALQTQWECSATRQSVQKEPVQYSAKAPDTSAAVNSLASTEQRALDSRDSAIWKLLKQNPIQSSRCSKVRGERTGSANWCTS